MSDKPNVVHLPKRMSFRLSQKEAQTHATTWVKLEDIILNEIDQLQNNKRRIILLILLAQNSQIFKDRK